MAGIFGKLCIATDHLRGDLRQSVRALARRPAFTLPAVVTLALGIGGTTAMFSIVDALLLRPPPYPDPAAIVTVATGASEGARPVGRHQRSADTPRRGRIVHRPRRRRAHGRRRAPRGLLLPDARGGVLEAAGDSTVSHAICRERPDRIRLVPRGDSTAAPGRVTDPGRRRGERAPALDPVGRPAARRVGA